MDGEKSNGAVIGSVIIIIILIVGGIYLIKTKIKEIKDQARIQEQMTQATANSLNGLGEAIEQ